jgi:hypothetical protein
MNCFDNVINLHRSTSNSMDFIKGQRLLADKIGVQNIVGNNVGLQPYCHHMAFAITHECEEKENSDT